MAKRKVILTFNKESGIYTGFLYHGGDAISQSDLNTKFFNYKTVEMDTETETWEGDALTGKVVKIEEQPTIMTELELDRATQQSIFRKYKYYKQLNIIFGILDTLLDSLDPSTETKYEDIDLSDYNEFKDFLRNEIAQNQQDKEDFINNPDFKYMTKEEEKQEYHDTYAGDGLRGIVNPEKPEDIIQ